MTEALDTQRHDWVARDGAEPGQCRGVEVADRNERGARAQSREELLGDADLAASAGRPPVAMQAVG